MARELNSKEFNGEIHRTFNKENYRCPEDLLIHIHNNQDIAAFESDIYIQGFFRFLKSMLEKMLQNNRNADLEHQLRHIFEQWANLTDENQHVILSIAIIHNQEDCHVPLPDDLDMHKFTLLTFNVLECIVASLLENSENCSTDNTKSFELHKDCWNNTPNYNSENNMVPYSDITGDVIFDEHIPIDFSVNQLKAYCASEQLLNLDENAILE